MKNNEYDFELVSLAFSLGRISRINERFQSLVYANSAEILGAKRTSAEYHAILSLLTSDEGELSPTQLCKHTLQTPGGMTKTLKRLEDDGLIKRFESLEDARSLMVKLTPAGQALAEDLMKLTLEAYQKTFRELTPAQFSSMVKLLRYVRKTLEVSIGHEL